VLFDYDLSKAIDQKSYWHMAHFDFHTSLHRKYRFVIPMLAAGVNAVLQLFTLIWPGALSGDFSMKFSFYLVNLTLAALWCSLIYRYCKAYGMSMIGALFGLLAVITSRWTMEYAGTPHTDLLFCLALICMLYGIKTKHNAFILAAIFLGPFSKESFLFAAPILFFSTMPKGRIILLLLLTGAAVFGTRYLIDAASGTAMTESIAADLNILQWMLLQLGRLKVTGYWIELFATFGLWWLLPLIQKIKLGRMPETRAFLKEPYVIAFLFTSAFQIILNGEFARMMYMLMPVYAVIVGFAADHLFKYYQSKQQFLS